MYKVEKWVTQECLQPDDAHLNAMPYLTKLYVVVLPGGSVFIRWGVTSEASRSLMRLQVLYHHSQCFCLAN